MPSLGSEYKGRTSQELHQICKRVYWDEKQNCYVDSDTSEPITDDDRKRFNLYKYERQLYASSMYRIINEVHMMTTDEWIEICDGGQINFGGHRTGNDIVVYTD